MYQKELYKRALNKYKKNLVRVKNMFLMGNMALPTPKKWDFNFNKLSEEERSTVLAFRRKWVISRGVYLRHKLRVFNREFIKINFFISYYAKLSKVKSSGFSKYSKKFKKSLILVDGSKFKKNNNKFVKLVSDPTFSLNFKFKDRRY